MQGQWLIKEFPEVSNREGSVSIRILDRPFVNTMQECNQSLFAEIFSQYYRAWSISRRCASVVIARAQANADSSNIFIRCVKMSPHHSRFKPVLSLPKNGVKCKGSISHRDPRGGDWRWVGGKYSSSDFGTFSSGRFALVCVRETHLVHVTSGRQSILQEKEHAFSWKFSHTKVVRRKQKIYNVNYVCITIWCPPDYMKSETGTYDLIRGMFHKIRNDDN